MFDYVKSLRNKEGRGFNRIKYNIEQNGNNDISDELRNLCIDKYARNRETYKNFKKRLYLKFFLKYEIPLICLLGCSYFTLTTPRKSKIVPVYNMEQTVISDQKLITDVDTNNYVVNPFWGVDLGDNYYELDEIQNVIQYQVKNGTRNVIVTLNLSDNGEFKVSDALVSNFFDYNSDIFKDVEPSNLDAKYQELVDDISNYILDASSNGSDSFSKAKREIKKLLNEEKTTVITSVMKYYKIDEIKVDQGMNSYYLLLALKEASVVLATILISIGLNYVANAGVIRGVYADKEELKEYMGESIKVNLFKTIRDARRQFVIADDNRKNEIKKLTRNYLTDDCIKKFEK